MRSEHWRKITTLTWVMLIATAILTLHCVLAWGAAVAVAAACGALIIMSCTAQVVEAILVMDHSLKAGTGER